MGPRKDPEKVPEIPYSGALKKVFEPILNANFPCNDNDVNVGKKYWIQRKLATPRQWYLELYKLPKDSGFAFRVLINAILPPATEPAFATISSVVVSDVKVNGSNIIVWVENSSGSVANLIFNEDEDKFQARLYTAAVAHHDEALKELRDDPLLDSQDIRDLNGNARQVAKVLKSVLTDLTSINALHLIKVMNVDANRGRKRVPTPAAPSRDKSKGKSKVEVPSVAAIVQGVPAVAAAATVQDVGEQALPAGNVQTPTEVEAIAGGQLPSGRSVAGIHEEQVHTSTANKRRRVKKSARNQSGDRSKMGPEVQSPNTRRVLENEFREACIPVEAQAMPVPKKRREGIHQHPRKTGSGQQIDVEDRAAELKQFKERTKPIFPFGQGFLREVSVDLMVVAPPEFKYRPFHDSLVKTLLDIMLTAIHPHKQTLTLMPICGVRPTSFDDVKNGLFHIINGQHSWAAAKQLIENPLVSEEEKEKWKYWKCDFVWTDNLVLLSDFSRRANNQNQHQWNSPEYLLHIQYARDLWITYGRPQAKPGVKVTSKERNNWKDFQVKAAETLNSMLDKNSGKSSKEYQGEFKVICADDELYNATMKAFQWYENGELLNPDTRNKWKHEAEAFENKEWSRKYIVAYTFKCVRSLGRESLLELIHKITCGLSEKGEYLPTRTPPKVFLGGNKPKSKKVSTLKEWTDRKKAKNGVVRWLSRQTDKQLWAGEDVNAKEWKDFKKQVGFTSAHMDELIRRATKGYLSKFMKVSDKPKREQVPPSDAFLSEMQRVLRSRPTVDPALAPVLSWYQNNGELTEYARERRATDKDVPAIEGWFCNDLVAVQPADFSFMGGIIDLRVVDRFLEDEEIVLRNPTASPYISFLSTFAKPDGSTLTTPCYWMVIAHSNKAEQVEEVFQHYFPSWQVSESRYVPAAGEKFFFSNSTLKIGNGVVIYKLAQEALPPLFWKKQVASDESYRKVGEIREYGVYDHELRMETYLNYVSQLSAIAVQQNGPRDILCITAGRKPLIAAVMCDMRPVAVVVYEKPSGLEYLHAHVLGCKLGNFHHLFDSSIRTEDVYSDDWLLPTVADVADSDDDAVHREIRMKRRGDRRHVVSHEAEELENNSGDSTEMSSEEGESTDDDVPEMQRTEIVHSISPTLTTPITPSSVPEFCTGLVTSSPAAEIYRRSAFSSFSPDLEQLLRNVEVGGMVEPSSGDLVVLATASEHAALCGETVGVVLSTSPVGSCSPERQPSVQADPMVVEPEEVHGEDVVAAELETRRVHGVHTGAVQQQVIPKEEALDVTENPCSNKDDPIIIDSDEDDHILSGVRTDIPSDEESDLSDMPVEIGGDSSEAKVSQQRALRIQLKAISKKKLSVNRASLRKNRELEFQNRKLILELAMKSELLQKKSELLQKERELRQQENELRQQAHDELRSCGLRNVLLGTSDCPSPSVGRSYQATTSIASAPELSFSEANPEIQVAQPMQEAREDCIPGTQESTFERQNAKSNDNTNVKVVKARADKHQLRTKVKFCMVRFHSFEEKFKRRRRNNYLYISDSESVSPKYFECTKLPRNRLVQNPQLAADDDEVTSILRET